MSPTEKQWAAPTRMVWWGGPDTRVMPQMWKPLYLREQSQGYSFSTTSDPPTILVSDPFTPQSGKSSRKFLGAKVVVSEAGADVVLVVVEGVIPPET